MILGPLLFLSIWQVTGVGSLDEPAVRVLALAAWMVCWWVTEAVPIPITALLPMVAMPLLEIANLRTATAPYADPIIYLFMGGFMIALGMEEQQLHKRIALNLIRLTGTNPNGIILGFMVATAFLSMWISNTATAVMMLPIAMSIMNLVQKSMGPEAVANKGFRNFALSLMLSIAYASNIGGVVTIIGTPPNVVLVGYMEQFYQYSVAFNTWLLIGIPLGVTMLTFTYLVLVKWLFRSNLGNLAASGEVIQVQIKSLGPLSKGEKRVAVVFTVTACLWIFREPLNNLIGKDLLNDTLIAMAGGIAMFVVPIRFREQQYLISWKSMERMPWGILLLFGGGLSLAKAMESTGIIQLVGQEISGLQGTQIWVVTLLLTSVSLFLTELMSNVALVTIFLPVVMGIADGLQVSPMLFCVPVTIASSFAFMLPISTPPNAILFASGYIGVKDMIRAGAVLNLLSILLLVLASVTLVAWVY